MNRKNNEIAMLGGDMRQYSAAEELAKRGWSVRLWGVEGLTQKKNITICDNILESVHDTAAVVLPLPVSSDGINLNCPLKDLSTPIRLSDIASCVKEGTLVVGGRMSKDFTSVLEEKGIIVKDYFVSDEFQIHNAYITAEAALNIAMNSLDKNLSEAKVAITGYGRIAKHLVRLLKKFDVDVTVAARKSSDLAWAYSSGCSVKRIGAGTDGEKNINSLSHGYDVIYNTVPARLFDRDFLLEVDKNTFIIDLASAPGGVDICAAKELGSKVLWATSLPGKYAPISAGKIIAICVDDIIRNEVVL